MQEDAVDARDGAAHISPWDAVINQMCPADAQLLHCGLHLAILQAENSGGVSQVCGREAGLREWLSVLHSVQPTTGHRLSDRQTLSRDDLQQAPDDMLTAIGHIRRHCVGALQNAALQTAQGGGAEWQGGSYHEVEKHTQSPHVHIAANVRLLPEEFRSRIGRRAAEGFQDRVGLALSAEAKVPHFDAAACGVEYILCLQVPVYYVVVMLGDKERREGGREIE